MQEFDWLFYHLLSAVLVLVQLPLCLSLYILQNGKWERGLGRVGELKSACVSLFVLTAQSHLLRKVVDPTTGRLYLGLFLYLADNTQVIENSNYICTTIITRVGHFILRAPAIRASNPQNPLARITSPHPFMIMLLPRLVNLPFCRILPCPVLVILL